jgi:hypothetical protein
MCDFLGQIYGNPVMLCAFSAFPVMVMNKGILSIAFCLWWETLNVVGPVAGFADNGGGVLQAWSLAFRKFGAAFYHGIQCHVQDFINSSCSRMSDPVF